MALFFLRVQRPHLPAARPGRARWRAGGQQRAQPWRLRRQLQGRIERRPAALEDVDAQRWCQRLPRRVGVPRAVHGRRRRHAHPQAQPRAGAGRPGGLRPQHEQQAVGTQRGRRVQAAQIAGARARQPGQHGGHVGAAQRLLAGPQWRHRRFAAHPQHG